MHMAAMAAMVTVTASYVVTVTDFAVCPFSGIRPQGLEIVTVGNLRTGLAILAAD